jgi:hypothetical protein
MFSTNSATTIGHRVRIPYIAAILGSLSFAALADVPPSSDPVDDGIVTGALFSKTVQVKIGDYAYAVIAADRDEPACNSVQVIVRVEDPDLGGGESSVIYNLGLQVSEVSSVTADSQNVRIAVRRNDIEDCSKGINETYTIQYTGNPDNLAVVKK